MRVLSPRIEPPVRVVLDTRLRSLARGKVRDSSATTLSLHGPQASPPPGLPAEIREKLEAAFRSALADTDFVREAERLGLPLAPRIGADYRNDVAALETQLRGLWQRRPWKES